jgi:Family of unknown function (DUF6498)
MKRPKKRPRISFSTGLFPDQEALRDVMPFRRSWKAILFIAVFAIAFTVPAVLTFVQARAEWSQLDTLSDLVSALFLSAWLLGWSIAPLILNTLLIVLLFGREVLFARPGIFELAIGLPGLMLMVEYDVTKMRNLRVEIPEKNSGKSWRGPHMAFDYEGRIESFGSDIDNMKASDLTSRLVLATGSTIRRGSLETEMQAGPVAEQGKTALVQKLSELLRLENYSRSEINTSESASSNVSSDNDQGRTSSIFTFSTLVLILANLVPIAGAIYFGWDLASVLVIYWAESGVIGFYNFCKILVIGGWTALFSGIIFISHFGAFMAVHFLFLYHIFIQGLESSSSVTLDEVAMLFTTLWPALAALFISHGISFIQNFIGHQEYRNKTVGKQVHEPYQRIIFMHMVIIIGAFMMSIIGDSTVVLMLVIAAKIVVDIRAHVKERNAA